MGPKLTGGKRRRLTQFLRAYRSYFAFNMKELGALIGLGIRIELASDTPIFHHPYRYNDMERDLIRNRMLDLLEAGLVECRMVSMHQPLPCLPKKMYMATTRIGGCVETTILSIGRLSPISMPCLHVTRSLMF